MPLDFSEFALKSLLNSFNYHRLPVASHGWLQKINSIYPGLVVCLHFMGHLVIIWTVTIHSEILHNHPIFRKPEVWIPNFSLASIYNCQRIFILVDNFLPFQKTCNCSFTLAFKWRIFLESITPPYGLPWTKTSDYLYVSLFEAIFLPFRHRISKIPWFMPKSLN